MRASIKLSAVILTKNEERSIGRCIESVKFCDEIIVVDDFSHDQTVNIAKKLDAQIYEQKLAGDFASQRNFGLEKAKGEWILFIDADEEVTDELKEEINKVIHVQNNNRNGTFYLKRRDFWWGREIKYGEISKVRNSGLIRLVKKNSGKWIGKVHEQFNVKTQMSNVKCFKNYINHYPHETVRDFLQEINYYSTLRAKELLNQDNTVSIFAIVFYPFFKFILNYFIYLGFLDGAPGFAYAFFMSFHSFLVRAKLYQYTRIDTNA